MSGTVKFFLVLSMVAAVDFTGEYEVIGAHQPIKALVGQGIILPCHLEPPADLTSLTLEWRFSAACVHVYRNRKDDLTLQHKDFKGRTSLFHDEMRNGNLSLKISSVNKADAGNYTCFVPKLDSEVRRGYIYLIVSHNVGVDVGIDVGIGIVSIIIIMAI